ncbi:MAG: hypothetical protein QMD00_04715, partial [Hadesarchaea archaeon]|nr:hypothetical protein [Hadesarchaea archaeon]
MQKRTIFTPNGSEFRGDERGLTPVIGAVLVIGFVIMAISVYIKEVVPSYLRHNEAEHFNTVRSVFL